MILASSLASIDVSAGRKPRPHSSIGMSVLVQDAAESIASSDTKAVKSVRFCDRWVSGRKDVAAPHDCAAV
jgi:hypothetical protein